MTGSGDIGRGIVDRCVVVAVVVVVFCGVVIVILIFVGLVKGFRCTVVGFGAVFLAVVIGVCVLVVISCHNFGVAKRLLFVVSVVCHFGVIIFFGE